VADIILLDGGMGQELLNRSNIRNPKHWSAEYLMQEPDLVRQIHLEYIAVGARVITINAYAASYTRMAMVGAEERVPELQRIACTLAREAREAAGANGQGVAIAGCLPPVNGSYRADRVRAFDLNLDEYQRIAELQAPLVDLFICETMSTAEEARAAATAAAQFGKPVWVSWTLVDEGTNPRLRSNETIGDAFKVLSEIRVSAVLANCSQPEALTAAMPDLVATGLPTGGYANGFTSIPATFLPGKTKETLNARQDLDPAAYAAFAMQWVDAGATLIGGCCEVGPAHIARIRDELIAAGHRIGSLSS
jgi:S-methylmethionine-dependent homocysteine/selenocysteine methylase